MRTLGKWLGRILLSLALAAVLIGIWKREEIMRLWAVNSLFAEEKIVSNFSHMDDAFLTKSLPRGDGPVSPLPEGDTTQLPETAADWIKDRAMTSLLVMKDGSIRYEEYFLGTTPDDRRISWSIAKSYLSALFGVLLDEGAIGSLDDPVTQYAPQLVGTAYDGASIRNVLNMASGVIFDEDYHDPDSDINRMGRIVALGGTLDDFTASFNDRFSDPGLSWKYVSIDTHVIGMVIRGATGRSVSDLLAEKIIHPLGQEQDGYYLTDGAGVAFVLGGLNMTTRDYARFGQMYLQNGMWNGTQIVPSDWVAASTVPSANTAVGDTQYGYQWWMPADAREGEYFARGIYGQYVYVNRATNTVIAVNSADRLFREDGAFDQNLAAMRAIANAN